MNTQKNYEIILHRTMSSYLFI